MEFRKNYKKKENVKTVIDKRVSDQYDKNDENALLWLAIEELYKHLEIEMPQKCKELRQLIETIKNKTRED